MTPFKAHRKAQHKSPKRRHFGLSPDPSKRCHFGALPISPKTASIRRMPSSPQTTSFKPFRMSSFAPQNGVDLCSCPFLKQRRFFIVPKALHFVFFPPETPNSQNNFSHFLSKPKPPCHFTSKNRGWPNVLPWAPPSTPSVTSGVMSFLFLNPLAEDDDDRPMGGVEFQGIVSSHFYEFLSCPHDLGGNLSGYFSSFHAPQTVSIAEEIVAEESKLTLHDRNQRWLHGN